jgi:hypothetical protein
MTEEEKSKDNTDAQTEEVKENPPQDAGEKVPEKISLTQKELDGKLADARRKAEAAQKEAQKKYDDLLASIEAKQAANDAAAEQVEALRKDLPEAIAKLWTNSRPSNSLNGCVTQRTQITKKQIPELPNPAEGHGKQRKQINVV